MADGNSSSPRILPDLTQTLADMQAKLAALTAENAALRSAPATALRCKVTEKGALSVYGLGQWPITLYRSQWERLIPYIPQVSAFIAANSASLTVKPPKT